MSKFKRTRWKEGMVFGIPLDDGSFGLAQAIGLLMENIVHVAVFSIRFKDLPSTVHSLDKRDIVSLNATWTQDLNSGTWTKLGILEPCVEKSDFPNQKLKDRGLVGVKCSDAGLFSKFLSSYHGLRPWNEMLRTLNSVKHNHCARAPHTARCPYYSCDRHQF